MKKLINHPLYASLLMLLFTITSIVVHGQDTATSTTSTATSTTATKATTTSESFVMQPWMWIVAGVIVIIIIAALLGGKRGDKTTVTRTTVYKE